MARDFDKEREERMVADGDRIFTLGGTQFTYRASVRPEDIADWNEAIGGQTNPTEREWIALYDKTILNCLDPGQEELWAQMRQEAEPRVSIGDLASLLDFLFTEHTGRPTGPSSDSSSAGGENETGLTDASSPQQAEASAT